MQCRRKVCVTSASLYVCYIKTTTGCPCCSELLMTLASICLLKKWYLTYGSQRLRLAFEYGYVMLKRCAPPLFKACDAASLDVESDVTAISRCISDASPCGQLCSLFASLNGIIIHEYAWIRSALFSKIMFTLFNIS